MDERGPNQDTDRRADRATLERGFQLEEDSRVQHFQFALAVSRERKTRKDILFHQKGKISQNVLVRHEAGEVSEHVTLGEGQSANARFAASLAGLRWAHAWGIPDDPTLCEKRTMSKWKGFLKRDTSRLRAERK